MAYLFNKRMQIYALIINVQVNKGVFKRIFFLDYCLI